MPVLIPLRSDLPFFDLRVELEGSVYTLQFRWNVRLEAWFLDVLDEEGETYLLAGRRLAVDYPIAPYVTARAPGGALVAVDTSGAGQEAGLTDLGGRVHLTYYTRAELGL